MFNVLLVLFACNQNAKGEEDENPKTISIKKIIVQDSTISLNATNEKIMAIVIPATANQTVNWTSEDNKILTIHFNINEDGKLAIIDNPSYNNDFYHRKIIRIKAISLADGSVVATKVITVYNNPATLKRINIQVTEWIHCKESNNFVYNGTKKLNMSINFADDRDI